MGFAEDIGKFMVVCWDTHHVNWNVVGSGFVGKEELVDLSIVHLGEMGKGHCIDE